MRSDLAWFGELAGLPATSPDPGRLATAIQREMRGIPMGEFPIAAEPVMVPATSYDELLSATRALLDLQRRAVLNLAPDLPGRVAALEIDPAYLPRLTDDEAFELRHCADVARADVMITADGPRFIEFNVSASINGLVQFDSLRRARGLDAVPSVFALLARMLTTAAAELGLPPSVLLIGTRHDPDFAGGHYDAQVGFLRENGVPARFTDMEELETVDDLRSVLGLIQFSEHEALTNGWDLSQVPAAQLAGLRAIPSQSTRLVDSKKTLALISEGLPWMSVAERELVRRYVPWTRVMGDRHVEWRGRRCELPRLITERQELFVLKGAGGYGSQEVFFGPNTDPQEWERLVREAADSRYYVAQELVRPVRHPLRLLHDSTGKTETITANSVVSPFCIGEGATGCLLRFNDSSGPGAVTVHSGARLGWLTKAE